MTTSLQSYVCGAWRTGSGKARSLHNPTTEQVLAEIKSLDPAKDNFSWEGVLDHGRTHGAAALGALTFAERGALLKQISKLWHDAREELIEISIRNGGNTRGDAKFDLDGATGTLAAYASIGKRLGDTKILPDGDGMQLGRTPRFWGQHVLVPRPGVAVHINAYNFPGWGMGEKMACSLLAGMPVIEKPGTPSALLAYRMAQLLVESKILPEGAFQFISGSTGNLLDLMGPQDCMAFTGSAGTGFQLRSTENLLRRGVRVNVEADSLNSAVLAPDLDSGDDAYQEFLQNVVTDITQKAGQKCTAVRRILVPEDQVEDVVEALIERLDAVVVGDPADDNSRMGPVASESQFRDVKQGIETLVAAGARVVRGGTESIRDQGWFVAATLLVASDATAEAIHRDEVFGPAATILPYSGKVEDAVDLVNRGGGMLVSSIYSNDRKWTEAFVYGAGPWHGRLWLGSDKTAGQAFAPGMVMPTMIHGGPGKAGAGEELGGRFGLSFYMQRVALQGYQGFVARTFGASESEPATAKS